MKSATRCVGASSSRWPEGSATIASENDPQGVRSHRPTTTRTPDVVPTPAIRPWKR